ncbi:MAG: hypothetical protein WC773_02030 [Patescibacteria group bacterium]|jgi:hypothetical protein
MARRPTLDELRQLATWGDISHVVDRWYRGHQVPPEVMEAVQVGYYAMARNWLKSMLPAKMYRRITPGEQYPAYQSVETRNGRVQIGSYSLGQRLTAARRWATKAKLPLEKIAADYGLTHLLAVTPEPEPDPIPRGS